MNYETYASSAVATAVAFSARSVGVIAYLVSAAFLALYLLVDRSRLLPALYAFVPERQHARLERITVRLETIVGGYIRGQVLTSALLAVFTYALLTLCHVEGALALGVLAGVADVLPYVGVFFSVGPAAVAAIAQGPFTVAIVVLAMLAYEEFESRFLIPRIYGRALKLPSSVVLFSLLTGGALLGISGAFLALPVAASLRMLLEEWRVRDSEGTESAS
jgi:predicted PurR-regulated permease PerM